MVGTDRAAELLRWYQDWSGNPAAQLACVSGDASFRRYFRSRTGAQSVVLVDSPPDKEKNAEFVAIAQLLAQRAVRVPGLLGVDMERGFLALEDLGDQLLLPLLDEHTVDGYYRSAMDLLQTLARTPGRELTLPAYDHALLVTEMDLFGEWFCGGFLKLDPASVAAGPYGAYRDALCARALAQSQVLVHRDFHARNIMVLPHDELALIDFQDAVLGPVTYDLVSLLKDCYIRCPRARVCAWVEGQRQRLEDAGLAPGDKAAFLKDFDWMGLQRHTKVLGIFARLSLRDGKDAYRDDLPLVVAYVREALALYGDDPAMGDFHGWFEDVVMPRVREQSWHREEAISL